MNNRKLNSAAEEAAAVVIKSCSPTNNINSLHNSVYLKSAQFNHLNYSKSSTTITMTCSDSDSDEEYPRRWMDRLEYSNNGEILKIDFRFGFYVIFRKKTGLI